MKARLLSLILMLLSGITGFCATITVTAAASDTQFSPADITISTTDIVDFQLDIVHNAVEVGRETYDLNQASPLLPGGFIVNFGGGSISNLEVGTHYFVCQSHAGDGMKGSITVTALGINDFDLVKSYTVFPNPTTDFVNVKSSDDFHDLIYRVTDVNGREIVSGKLDVVSAAINVSQFTPGVYFVQLGNDRRHIFRILKE